MRQSPEVVATATELRIRIRIYAHRFAHLVEEAADEIMGSGDPAARRAALEWKSKAIAQAQTSCFHSDPMAALFDTWALAIQQRLYFEDTASARHFGEWQPLGLAAAETIEDEIEVIAREIKRDGDVSKSRKFVETWASAHPVQGEWLRRKSILGQLAEAIAADNLGAFARLGRLSEDVSDLSMRASLYNEMLPKQSRWQAELLAYDMGLHELPDVTLETIPRLTELTERAVVVAETMPAVVQLEREAVLAEFHEEVTRALELVREEREALVEEAERIAAAQWPLIRDDLPTITGRTVAQVRQPIEELIDHAALRVAQVGGAGLGVAFLLGLLLIRLARRGNGRA